MNINKFFNFLPKMEDFTDKIYFRAINNFMDQITWHYQIYFVIYKELNYFYYYFHPNPTFADYPTIFILNTINVSVFGGNTNSII